MEPGLKAPPKEETEESGLASGQVVPRRQSLRFEFCFAHQVKVDDAEAAVFPGDDRTEKRAFTLAFDLATPAS
jgi:hypothetical protein